MMINRLFKKILKSVGQHSDGACCMTKISIVATATSATMVPRSRSLHNGLAVLLVAIALLGRSDAATPPHVLFIVGDDVG
jgi:hypothetical protein